VEAGVEAGVVVGQASKQQQHEHSSGSNVNAIAGHERSSSSKQCMERDLAG